MIDMSSEVYRLKETLSTRYSWYGATYGNGTIREGELFIIEKEPDSHKKLYRLSKLGKFPCRLQVRPNDFKRYFEKVEGNNNEG